MNAKAIFSIAREPHPEMRALIAQASLVTSRLPRHRPGAAPKRTTRNYGKLGARKFAAEMPRATRNYSKIRLNGKRIKLSSASRPDSFPEPNEGERLTDLSQRRK